METVELALHTPGCTQPPVLDLDPRTDPRWQALIEQHRSDVFHSPAWMRVLTETYGFDAHGFVLLDDAGKPAAGIACCGIEDAAGARISSLPFSDFCDPLVQTPAQWRLLLDEILDENLPFVTRCLHNPAPLDDGRLNRVNRAKWHGADLSPDPDALWQNVHASSRKAIRKALRNGLSVRVAETEADLRAFFEMHLGIRKHKYRLLAQPYRFFRNIWKHFIEPGNGRLLLAEHLGRIIASVLFLEWQDSLYYKFNASCAEQLSFRPNDLLLWEGIKYGKSRGLSHLDLGLSDWDQEGLIRYKRKYATREKTISFLRHEPAVPPGPQTHRVRQLLPQLTDLFTDPSVPDRVTERAGELLYGFFS